MTFGERLAEAAEDWRTGRGYGYPRCCIVHYCWDIALGRGPLTARHAQIQYEWAGPDARWDWRPRPWDGPEQIPCGVIHSRGSPFPLLRRMWRILAFNLGRLHSGPELAAPARPAQVLWADDVTYECWLRGTHVNVDLDWS